VSDVRTNDLLGAIQAARRLNLACLQGLRHMCGSARRRNVSAFCVISQEFRHATASASPQSEPGGRHASGRRHACVWR
jgi:hypothetical protein